MSIEPGQRGELVLEFLAGPGDFSQQLHFFLDADEALHERTMEVAGTAAPAAESIQQ